MTTGATVAREKLLRQELARFIDIVTQQMHPECIILFGSLVTGQVDEWSDLDLVVIVHTDLPFYERIKQVLRSVASTSWYGCPRLHPGRMDRDETAAVLCPRRNREKRA